MRKPTSFSALLFVLTMLAAPALAADNQSSAAVVTINGYSISKSVETAFIEDQIMRGASDTPEFRKAVHDELTRRALLLSEAHRKGLDKIESTSGQMEIASQLVLIRAYFADYLKNNPITNAEIQEIYQTFIQQLGPLQYKPRHILLATEEEAKAIIARLNAGENFSNLVKESKDQTSKEKGGDLGWTTPISLPLSFSNALKTLQKGQYTKVPVQTPSGYHIIYLEDIQELTPPTPEQIKSQLVERASQQKIEKLISELIEKNIKTQ
jgi:peptidyl-prolyl cis-trans isomerase C